MNDPSRTDRRMPYPEVDFEALHERIRRLINHIFIDNDFVRKS